MANNDRDIVHLASQVSEASDEQIPIMLLQIRKILAKFPEYSKERQILKQEILKYDLTSWCCIVLKYDYSKVKGGFTTAVSLIQILFDCCVGLNLEDSQEFFQTTLPEALQSALFIAWNVQQVYVEKQKNVRSMKILKNAEEIDILKTQYNDVLDAVSSITTSHPYLVDTLLKSDNLIRLLVDESDSASQLTVAALNMLLRSIRVSYLSVKNLSTVARNHLMDELIYKVTASQNEAVAAVTVKIIVAMVDADSEIANKLSTRFKGLKALLTRWKGRGFDHILQKLIDILDAGNSKIAELARRTHAVKTIWAAYKGWKTRTRVQKLHRVVPSLQSSFRRKRKEKLDQELSKKFEYQREHDAELSRKRSMRSTRERQLHSLEILPASKINHHIQQEEEKSAIKVQSIWRGYMQRRRFSQQQYIYRASRAAIVIQRAVRKFLASREKMRQSRRRSLPIEGKLTTERKEELQMRIKQWQATRGVRETSLSKAKEIHDRTQQKLLIYHSQRVKNFINQPKVDALMAKIHTEKEILENLPKLSDATLEDIESLACTSNAVTMAAEHEHKKMMQDLTSSWWKKLAIKTGDNLDPFEDRSKPNFDSDMLEIEEFLNPIDDKDILF